MHFPIKLETATLLKRYKRFLADVRLENGQELTIHCPNSGSMRSCSEPGSPVCYSTSDNPKRKYPHTLEMVYNALLLKANHRKLLVTDVHGEVVRDLLA